MLVFSVLVGADNWDDSAEGSRGEKNQLCSCLG